MSRMLGVDISFGLLNVNVLVDVTIQESSDNIHLMQLEIEHCNIREQDPDRCELDDRSIRQLVVHPMLLLAPFSNPAHFGFTVFDPKHPATFEHMHSWSARYEIPSVVTHQCTHFAVESGLPKRRIF
eukprot:Pompholyxophrys_sp_v1_NODE_250_length_973_cov_1.748366.p2 type:complete len:127 gc:universal NODE_250_length_973_cov_1.748366:340-720(+)